MKTGLKENSRSGARVDLSAEEKKARSTFTSEKLTWTRTVIADLRLSAGENVFAIYIASCINWRSGNTFVSDRTAAEETGVCRNHIHFARKELVRLRWLTVTRRNQGAPYTYRLGQSNVSAMLDLLQIGRDKRAEERKTRGAKGPVILGLATKPLPKNKHPNREGTTESAHPPIPKNKHRDVPKSAHRDVPKTGPIHLRDNTEETTPIRQHQKN